MATKRAAQRRARPTAEDLLLDAFFAAWSRGDTPALASAIHAGHVTGAALAQKLGWSWDKVSRRTDELRAGGIVSKRRDAGWMRTTLITAGAEAAQRWVALLMEADAEVTDASLKLEARNAALSALSHGEQRQLLLTIKVMPGATQAELIHARSLPQPTISRHLTRLVAAGLVEVRRSDGRARHHVQPETLGMLRRWLEQVAAKSAKGAQTAEQIILTRPGAREVTAPAPEAPSPAPPPAENDAAASPPPAPDEAAQSLNDDEPPGPAQEADQALEPPTEVSDAA